MIYIILALIILIAIIGIFIYKQNKAAPETKPTVIADDCCGSHSVCERDSLLSTIKDIVYFDDEELDVLTCRPSTSFSDDEIKMIEEVFYSLREQDIAGWIRSIQLRRIDLPEYIKDEALLIVSERREKTLELYNSTHPNQTTTD